MLNAVSATWAILRRPILVAFYDTHGERRTQSRLKPRDPTGVKCSRRAYYAPFAVLRYFYGLIGYDRVKKVPILIEERIYSRSTPAVSALYP